MSSYDIRKIPRRFAAVAAALATLLVASAVAATNAQAAQGCRVDYAVPSQWPGGFTATVRVTNLGDPITGWSLGWAFPSGQQVTQAWNAIVTSSGAQVTAKNASYNAGIATGASGTRRRPATRWPPWPRCSPAGTSATRSTPSRTRPRGATRSPPGPCCATCVPRATRASGCRSRGATTTAPARTTRSTRPGSAACARSWTGPWSRTST